MKWFSTTVTLIVSVALFCSCNHSEKKPEVNSPTSQPLENTGDTRAQSKFNVKTYHTNAGWGYDVYMDSALYIHQPTIPAVPGNKGFSSEGDAGKVAQFVIYKIRNNIIPPSLTTQELDSLGVIK